MSETQHLETAQRLAGADYHGPVYDPRMDEYFASVADFAEAWEAEYADDDGALTVPLPPYVWACTTRRIEVTRSDVERMVDAVSEDHAEGVEPRGDLWTLIEAGVTAWNQQQMGETWDVDFSRAVFLGTGEEGRNDA